MTFERVSSKKPEGPAQDSACGRWYLVHTRPREESRAELNLRRQGYTVFLPRIARSIRHARQWRTVQAPLFSRYLFVPLDLARDRWISIGSTYGVASVVQMGGCPVPVPVGLVEALREATRGEVTRLDMGLRAGDQARVLSGPFADFVGEVLRVDERGRVKLLLKVMGGYVPLLLDGPQLAKAG